MRLGQLLRRHAALLRVLAAFAFLGLAALATGVFLARARLVRYPESFRELVEQKYRQQLAMLEEAALSQSLNPCDLEAFALPEIVEASIWRENPPSGGWISIHSSTGSPIVFKELTRPYYLALWGFRNDAEVYGSALNLRRTSRGSCVEYKARVALQGDEVVGYTISFDTKLLRP
jgi:hypothetical protein